jgi:hypothetical protein
LEKSLNAAENNAGIMQVSLEGWIRQEIFIIRIIGGQRGKTLTRVGYLADCRFKSNGTKVGSSRLGAQKPISTYFKRQQKAPINFRRWKLVSSMYSR